MSTLGTLTALPLTALLGLLALVTGILALALYSIATRLEERTGLDSTARVAASDTGQGRVARLEDKRLGMRGQPDYILQERVGLLRRWKVVPVEVKPTRRRRTLYEGDEMQIVSYMLLARRIYGRKFAGYGYVRYHNRTFKVQLTREREKRCLSYANLVREARRLEHVAAESPPLPCRCGRCP